MTDVVPELKKRIEEDFDARIAMDPIIRSFRKQLEKGTATAEDVSKYARRVGECASAALIATLKEENLPDGKMYYNIAERTIKPVFVKAHLMINEAAIAVQLAEDKKNGIGIKPIMSEFPEKRVEALINKIVHAVTNQGRSDEQD